MRKRALYGANRLRKCDYPITGVFLIRANERRFRSVCVWPHVFYLSLLHHYAHGPTPRSHGEGLEKGSCEDFPLILWSCGLS